MLSYFFSFIQTHWGTIAGVLSYIALAFINAMPAPETPFRWYDLSYNALHSLANRQAQPYQAPTGQTASPKA